MIYICGRKVKVQTGKKSQTVNICTPKNIHGKYEYILRLRPPFVTEDTLRALTLNSVEELVRYLQSNHFGDIEKSNSEVATNATTDRKPENTAQPAASNPLSEWEQTAVKAAEECINQFLAEFIQYPYLHRREHSIHCELFKILASRKIFSRLYPIGRWMTQPVHKEWPEHIIRPDKGSHGEVDICIIAPEQIKNSTFKDFMAGRIRPTIAIEVGFDYGLRHLTQDAAKLRNSGVQNSYLIHLLRQDFQDDFETTETFILNCGLKVAYARLTSSRAYYKFLDDKEIKNSALPVSGA